MTKQICLHITHQWNTPANYGESDQYSIDYIVYTAIILYELINNNKLKFNSFLHIYFFNEKISKEEGTPCRNLLHTSHT